MRPSLLATRRHIPLAVLAVLLAARSAATAETGPRFAPADPVREAYVAEALAGNLALRGRRVGVDESLAALAQARAQLLPTVTLEARASERSGAVLDLGKLVNPAYAGLNQVIGREVYPTNLEVALPLKRETKITAVQPLFAPALWHQQALRREEAQANEAGWQAFARQLRADVETAYYVYGRAARVVEVLDRTKELLDENVRTASLLVKAGKATEDTALRARAELGELLQRRSEAVAGQAAARRLLNFLVNRDLEAPVPIPTPLAGTPPLPPLRGGVERREELRALDAAKRATTEAVSLARSGYLPTLALAAEYGFQGDKYDFSLDRDYFVGSLVLRWNLWNGFGDRARVQQASLAARRVALEREAIERGLTLALARAWDEAATARRAIATAGDRAKASRAAYAIVERRWKAGAALPVELLDARTTLTRAELDEVIATYDFAAKLVELDRVAALAPEVTR